MVIEIFTVKAIEGSADNTRYVAYKEFDSMVEWEKHLLLIKLSGEWAGHKIYPKEITLAEFMSLSTLERSTLPVIQKFDKEAILNAKQEIRQPLKP